MANYFYRDDTFKLLFNSGLICDTGILNVLTSIDSRPTWQGPTPDGPFLLLYVPNSPLLLFLMHPFG